MKKLYLALILAAALALLPAQNMPLTLTAPNGGEQWSQGSTYAITWEQQNLAGNVMLHLLGDNPAAATIPIASNIPVTDETFSWTIPAGIPDSDNYKVRIMLAANAGVMIQDLSDGFFSITDGTNPPPPPSITVVSPNGGETWMAGTAHPIAWQFTNLQGEVRITLVQPNSNNEIEIAPQVLIQMGQFMWQIPATFPAGSYKAHIVWITDLTVYIADMSDDFFFVAPGNPPPPQPLTLISPNGGEVWTVGSTYPITWSSQNLAGPATLHLIGANASTPMTLIAENIPVTDGVFNWTIPNAIPPSAYYRVRISLATSNGMAYSDISDQPFSIEGGTNPPPPQTWIQVMMPNGGEVFQAGQPLPIHWIFANLQGDVRITLVHANSNDQIVIAQQVPIVLGHFIWNIPPDFPTGMYKIHVVWLSVTGVYFGDMSDGFFEIQSNNPPPPQPITLVSPNGGEVWETGTEHPITWLCANAAGNVMIQLLGAANTVPVMVIAHNIPAAAGSFLWQIPMTLLPGDNYLVQISLINPNGVLVSDYSDAPFSIMNGNNPPPAPLTVLSPNGGEQWQKGETYAISWTDAEYTGFVRIFLVRRVGNHQRRLLIAGHAPNTGSYQWTIPYRVPPGQNYKILVRRAGGGMDLSDGFFSILPPVQNIRSAPNPTPGPAVISFEVKQSDQYQVRIYNLRGQLVRGLSAAHLPKGAHDLAWDGKDERGDSVSAGIYLVRISSPTFTATHKVMVVK